MGKTFTINMPALFNMINVVLYGLFYYVLHQMKIKRELIYKTLCFIGIAQAGLVILQYFNLGQFFFRISGSSHGMVRNSWPTGTLGNEALVSWCIALCSPFFLAFRELRYKIGFIICGLAIVATGCTAGMLAYAGGYLFWLFFHNRRVAIVLTCVGLLFVSVAVWSGRVNPEAYFNPRHRLKIWAKVVELTREAKVPMPDGRLAMKKGFITGHGMGSFRQVFHINAPEFRSHGIWAQAHNEYLQVLFEQGIIGLGIIMSLMWITFYNFIKSRKGLIPITCLVGFSIIAFFSFPMRTAIGIIPLVSLVLVEKEQ
jgi:O-antigen ligase